LIIHFKEEIIKRLKGIPTLELGLKMLHNPDDLNVEYASEKIDEHICSTAVNSIVVLATISG
jgi:hypothetical protein